MEHLCNVSEWNITGSKHFGWDGKDCVVKTEQFFIEAECLCCAEDLTVAEELEIAADSEWLVVDAIN